MDVVKELEQAENLKSMLEDYIIGPWDQLIRSSATFFTKCTKPKLKDVQRSAYSIGMTAVVIGALACGVKIVSRCVTTNMLLIICGLVVVCDTIHRPLCLKL
eukprot:15410_1